MKEPNNSESFRREAEARHVLKMPDEKRQEYYQGVLKHRGQSGVDYLITEVKRQRKLMRQKETALEI